MLPNDRSAVSSSPAWLALPLLGLAWLVVRRPLTVLVVASITALLSVYYAVNYLELRANRLDLLNPTSEFNLRWVRYLNEFQHEDDAILVVRSQSSDRRRKAIDEIAARLQSESGLCRDYLWRIDLSGLRRKVLYYLDPSQLTLLENLVVGQDDILRQNWDRHQLLARVMLWKQMARAPLGSAPPADRGSVDRGSVDRGPADRGQSGSPGPGSLRAPFTRFDSRIHPGHIERLPPVDSQASLGGPSNTLPGLEPNIRAAIAQELTVLANFLAGIAPQDQPPAVLAGLKGFDRLGTQYLESPDGQDGYVLIRLGDLGSQELARGGNAIERLRGVQRDMQQKFPDVEFGLTGLPIMEFDEMTMSQRDMTITTIISLVGVAIVFVLGFGALGLPLLSVLALLIATAWSFAGATFLVGHLNILSVSFNVILIGLGIDFGIHFLSKYSQFRQAGRDAPTAILQTMREAGTAIVTGGLTTAVAFGSASFTEFVGVAGLGIIAAQGMVACVLAQLTVLPALLMILDRKSERRAVRLFPTERLVNPLLRRSPLLAAVLLAATVALCGGISRVWYDHNLLNLQAAGVESVQWEHRLLKDSDNSAWFAVSQSKNADELLARKAEFLKLDTVQRCDEMVSVVPQISRAAHDRVRGIHDRLTSVPTRVPQLPVPAREELAAALNDLATTVSGQAGGATWRAPLQQIQTLLQQIPNPVYFQRVTAYQQHQIESQIHILRELQAVAHPDPPAWSDIPEELRGRFLGRNGTHLLKVYARGSVWDMDALHDFVRDMERTDPAITGQPVQTYYASQQMRDSYLWAAVYSAGAVFVTIYLDFGSVGKTCLAMIPAVLGMLQLLGLMGWFDIPLNPANMIALPLILGMGVDDGVHLVHNFRGQRGGYRIDRATATAVLLTSLTTMASFGSLLMAQHRGLQSLGLVLTLGMGTSLVASLWILPILLKRLTVTDELPGSRCRAASFSDSLGQAVPCRSGGPGRSTSIVVPRKSSGGMIAARLDRIRDSPQKQ